MPGTRAICVGLGLITFALYFPALRHDFLAYDDQQYVTENLHVRSGLTWASLVWAFGNHAGNWHPLAWISHELDCQIYGLRPWGHHLTNVLLHAANTMLLFVLLRRLTGAIWRSAVVAALFGWHPLHVESVTWVAERKDVLSAFFGLLAILMYVHYANAKMSKSAVEDQKERASASYLLSSIFYLLSLLMFALGLMSKPMVVTLPFVMLLFDFWPLGRLELNTENWKLNTFGGLVLEKIPFLVLAAGSCWLTLRAQQEAIVSTKGLAVGARIVHAVAAYGHYLGATFVPRHLAIMYPYEARLPAAQVIASALVLVGVTIVAIRFAKSQPWLIVGWLWFLGTLVPVIGLVQVGDQAWADRYTYLPLIGVCVAVVWEIGSKLQIPKSKSQENPKLQRPISAPRKVLFVGILFAAAMLVASSVQLSYWKNTRTLFEHAAAVTRNNYMAVTLLGSLLEKEGNYDEATNYYRSALTFNPGYPEAHFFLGHALDQQGKLAEAIAEYNQALWFKPSQKETHIFLGVALAKQKRYREAAAHYLAALNLDPESAAAHNNLAKILHTEGKLDEAVEHYRAALQFDPTLAQAHNNLGILLLQMGKVAEGAAQLREALRLNPGNAESQYNLALALNRQELWDEATKLFAKTVGAEMRDANAHYQFAMALAHLGKTKEATSQYAGALLIQPDFPDALDGLSWILATSASAQFRNGAEAVRMAERACELTGRKDPQKMKTLAAAYAEAGRFQDAVATAKEAGELAAANGRSELAALCQRMAESFGAKKAWR